ncbi:uncharacterized protein LOC133852645 [Alnus glutinosa]|uniref:uncharacterized protein LOC133852645 n=1 Tax=Alnus glutinosa TaxID=3517 RepID=UPI002D769D97|nr:uncharacterized protein LOC133852645 [Alnus glutinosa]
MIHTLKSKRGRGGLMAINLDMEKAFDKMEWSFLLAILHKLGFYSRWINWVRLCISTSSFSVLLNGSLFGLFSPSRELRQVQAAVIRNSSGTITHCTSLISPPCTAVIGEALAALLAIKLAISTHATSFILEGDSTTVTLALQNPLIKKDWRIAATVSMIHSLIPSTTSWSASSVNRSANFCAHHVAKWAASKFFSGCIPVSSFSLGSFSSCFGKVSSGSFLVH